jgi:hypothetical protein
MSDIFLFARSTERGRSVGAEPKLRPASLAASVQREVAQHLSMHALLACSTSSCEAAYHRLRSQLWEA